MRRTILSAANHLFLILAVSAALLATPLCGAGAEDVGRGSDPDLVRSIDSLLADSALRAGFQGILIQKLSDHTTLYERNADKVFLPASNNKLLTSGAALSLLGPNYVYVTRVAASATADRRGTVHGNLTLVGAGDPVLSTGDLSDLASSLRKSGVREIQGDITADDSLFDSERLGPGWTWDDEPYYYSAQISALNLDENLVVVRALPGAGVGDPARVVVLPTERYMTVRNTGRTAAAGTKVAISIERPRGENVLVVSGAIPVDATEQASPRVPVTVENPSQFAVEVFREALSRAGIRVRRRRFTEAPPTVTLAQHKSVPLSQMLKLLNKPSDNLIAECLLKTVGAVQSGRGTAGPEGSGATAARQFFSQIGMDMSELSQADGSGLSRYNYVSPRNLVTLLTYFKAQATFPVLYDSLPIAGVDGSLRNRLKGSPAAGNCHAKTGYISNASSLSGYVTAKDGEMLVFSMLMNNHLASNAPPVAVQDKIVLLLAGYANKGPAVAH